MLPSFCVFLFNLSALFSPPLDHLDNCDGVKYSLQLNLYKYILETYYNIPISNMTVATFHPLLDQYYMLPVPHYQHEVNTIVEKLHEEEGLEK